MMSATEQVAVSTSSRASSAKAVTSIVEVLPVTVSAGAGELAPSRSLSLSLPLLQEALVREMAEPGEDDKEVDEANLVGEFGGDPATVPFLNGE